MVLFPSFANHCAFLYILLSTRAPLTAGYAGGSTDSSELTFLGSEVTDEIREEYKVDPDTNPQNHPNTTYVLSKRTEYDLQDLTQTNLTLYGMTMKGETGDTWLCNAYFGDALCNSCTPCGQLPEGTFAVNQNGVKFDCSGIEDNRLCSGVHLEPPLAQEGDRCFVEDGEFDGKETCFIDALTTSPTEAPTSTPGGVSSLEGGLVASILLSVIATTGALFLDW